MVTHSAMAFDIIIFDFDGTLADTRECIVRSAIAAFDAQHAEPPDSARVVDAIGLSLPRMLAACSDQALPPELLDRIARTYCAVYDEVAPRTVRLFDGVAEVLSTVRSWPGTRLAIATSKLRSGLEPLLEHLGITPLFDAVMCDDDVTLKKPAPEMVERILEATDIAPHNALVVGDTTYDVEMGRASGAHTCAVTWGMHSSVRLMAAGPTYVVNDPREICRLAKPPGPVVLAGQGGDGADRSSGIRGRGLVDQCGHSLVASQPEQLEGAAGVDTPAELT